MSRGNEGTSGKGSGRQGGKTSAGSKGGNRRSDSSQARDGKSPARGNAPTGKPATRGGKNQVIGTSRSGKPVLKKEYIARKKSEGTTKPKSEAEGMRLNRYIGNSGICSRREADIYIQAGSVQVNGEAVTEMGFKVMPGDEVKFDGQSITPTKKEYYLLNKPKGFITPKKGERTSKTVFDLMSSATTAKLHVVGALTRPSLGLMLLTNDLEMANKLNNPNKPLRQIYHVTLDRNFKHEDMVKVRNGVLMDGEPLHVHDINFVEGGKNNEVGIEIHSSKENIVARIFESLKYDVKIIDRVVITGLTKKDLPRGNYRLLSKQELINLKML